MGGLRAILLGAMCLLSSAIPVQAADTVYQFYDDEGTLVVTNRPEDLPRGKAAKILVSYHDKPTGRPPVPAQPSSVTILGHVPPPRPTEARLSDAVRYRYYEVCAGTAAAALAQTRVLGPLDAREGERYSGQTRWTFGWSYDYTYEARTDASAGTVQVSAEVYDVNVYSDLEVLLPKLSRGCRMDDGELGAWEHAMGSLERHEMDHVGLVLNDKAIQGLADGIAGVRDYIFPLGVDVPSSVRRALQEDTHAAGMPWVQWVRQINQEYDRVTRHGLSPENRDGFFRNLQ